MGAQILETDFFHIMSNCFAANSCICKPQLNGKTSFSASSPLWRLTGIGLMNTLNINKKPHIYAAFS